MSNDFFVEEKAIIRALALSKSPGTYRATCPDCSKSRRNVKQRCLSMTVMSDHVVYCCHHCEKHGATFLTEETNYRLLAKPFVPPSFEPQKKIALKRLDVGLTLRGIDYLCGRAISLKTAQVYSLVSSRAYFRDLEGEAEAIAFPYVSGKKTIGHKVRCIEEKTFICDTALSSLFGVQCVDLVESPDIVICEGEIDPLSFYEAGVLNAVSVPNGSSSFNRTNDDGTLRNQLGFLWDAREIIDKAKRILIATDNDEPGEKLAEELARRIGKHRCWRVSYPEFCKDANDVLTKHSKDKLAECAATAIPWPVDGLYEADKYLTEVFDLYEHGFGARVHTGLSAVDGIFSIAPGCLTVVTGIPGAGKSSFIDQLMVNLARTKDYMCAICSFENPPAVHIGKLAAMLCQKHFFDTETYGDKITPAELNEVLPYIHRHFKFIHQDDGKKATVEGIIERIKTAVFRWGVQVVVIDPYNYIAKPQKIEHETAWIDEMLTEFRLLAQLYGLHIFFVAHPTKMQMNADGTHQMPKGYSISGSAAWFSKPDFGLTVHRETNGNVTICNWKTRYDWLGKNGQATVTYDNVRHTYTSDGFDIPMPYAYKEDDE